MRHKEAYEWLRLLQVKHWYSEKHGGNRSGIICAGARRLLIGMDHSEQNPKIQTKRHFTGVWVLLKQIKRKRKRCWRRAKGHGRMSRKRKRQGRQREMHVFQVRGQPKMPQQAALQFTGSIIMPKPNLWPPKPPVSESQLKRQPKCKILAAQSHTRNRFGAEAPQLTFQFQRRARDDQRLERTRGEERSEGEF